jgi:peptidoglycan hydrolase-like protein with peptidoglycan-binding domain
MFGGTPLSVPIVSRAQWGAKPWNGSPATISLSQRTEFFIHYHGGEPPHSTGVAVPREVERIHRGQGWAGPGYNFMIDQNGTVYEGRGWTKQGAHCPGHNVSGLGVYIAIGGSQRPSDAALQSARALYDEACRRTGRTLAKRGHRDGIATACPGAALYFWVTVGMPAPGDSSTPPSSEPSTSKPTPAKPSWDGKSFPGRGAFVLDKSHPAVTLLGQRLVAHGYGSRYKQGPGPTFTATDRLACQDFQRAQGWKGADADGYPGPTTWSRLMAAPKKSQSPLSSAVRPGERHAQVRELQRLLIAAGYGPIKGAITTYYGPQTQAAVARFHERNPQFRARGRSFDPAIGPKGFAELQKEVSR